MTLANDQIATVDAYIKSFPTELQGRLEELRKTIKNEIPNAEETISYKMPAYKLDGKFIVYFGGWKNHVSIYPFSAEMSAAIKGVSEYKTSGKGTIQFPNNKPLPLQIVRDIVSYLVDHKG